METQEIYCRITGRVQLVMFRDFTARRARRLGLAGYVKNLSDGSVEAVAQGAPERLEQFAAALRRGSLLSRVDRVDVEHRAPTARYGDFTIAW